MLRSFGILDRDGTITVERYEYLVGANQVELIPDSGLALRKLRDMGLGLVVVTNQSAVGRGLLSETALTQIHSRMIELLASEGASLDGVYVCPHRPEEMCSCRKPGTLLVERAAKELGFDAASSIVIGDRESDIEMGERLKATTILVRTGYGASVEEAGFCSPSYVVDDLYGAVPVIQALLSSRT